jgi:hypothetical protein
MKRTRGWLELDAHTIVLWLCVGWSETSREERDPVERARLVRAMYAALEGEDS